MGGLKHVGVQGKTAFDDYGLDKLTRDRMDAEDFLDRYDKVKDKDFVANAETIKLQGDEDIYGPGSKKHFNDTGKLHVLKTERLNQIKNSKGIHAHVRAVMDPTELRKAQRGEPARKVYSMLEIQSDAFQKKGVNKWDDTIGDPDETILGSPYANRLAAENPEKLVEILDGSERVAKKINSSLLSNGGRGPVRDVLTNPDAHGLSQPEVDDFLVLMQRHAYDPDVDFGFNVGRNPAEVDLMRRNYIEEVMDDYFVTSDRHAVSEMEMFLNSIEGQHRQEIKNPDFLSNAKKVAEKPDATTNPFKKTWEQEAMAAFFEKGMSKNSEAFRIPTSETVRTIQGYGDSQSDKILPILKRYDDIPKVLKKMKVDVSKVERVTDGFGNSWLEVPKDALPKELIVFKDGGVIKKESNVLPSSLNR